MSTLEMKESLSRYIEHTDDKRLLQILLFVINGHKGNGLLGFDLRQLPLSDEVMSMSTPCEWNEKQKGQSARSIYLEEKYGQGIS